MSRTVSTVAPTQVYPAPQRGHFWTGARWLVLAFVLGVGSSLGGVAFAMRVVAPPPIVAERALLAETRERKTADSLLTVHMARMDSGMAIVVPIVEGLALERCENVPHGQRGLSKLPCARLEREAAGDWGPR